jgi:hypothetical protein
MNNRASCLADVTRVWTITQETYAFDGRLSIHHQLLAWIAQLDPPNQPRLDDQVHRISVILLAKH